MKKFNKFIFLFISFMCAFFALSSNVMAKETTLYSNNEAVKGCTKDEQSVGNANANFWEIMCAPYTVVKNDDASKYVFSMNNYNFTFQYDYEIEFDINETYIKDKNTYVFSFLGISETTTVTYQDISIGSYAVFPETFVVSRYSAFDGQFKKITNFSSNSEGAYVLDTAGIYKLETTVENGGTTYATYVVYETGFYYSSLRSVIYDSDTQNVNYEIKVNTPRNLSNCSNISVKIVSTTSDIVGCSVNYGDRVGEYDISIQTTSQLTNVKSKTTTVVFNGVSMSATISYDSSIPVIVDEIITYYPKNMFVEEFALQYNDEPLTISQNSVAIFEYLDDSAVTVKLNDRECSVSNKKATCEITPAYGSTLIYSLEDEYGNEINEVHSDISYSNLNGMNTNTIKSFIEIKNNSVEFTNIDDYNEFDRICLFYGTTGVDYVCANITSQLLVESDRYYVGPISVVLTDINMNVIKFDYDNVTLDTGYDPSAYVVDDIIGNLTNTQDVTTEVSALIDLACAGNAECLSTVKVYGKYGDEDVLLSNSSNVSNLKLPTYLEILNKGFALKDCAFSRCNESIEVYVSYKIGGVNQKLSAKYNYIDQIPQITTEIDDYSPTRTYDFSDLNVEDFRTKLELFADSFSVTLDDGNGTTYQGEVTARFVKYTNRNGVSTPLSNKPYNYLKNKTEFGYYLLEGKVRLTKNLTTGTDITTEMYGKSFFVNVELADTKPPQLQLIGEATMHLKQYDVFKDPEFKCNDNSRCTMSIKYYYEGTSNEVDKVDTTIPGTYTIVYTAIDADGNVSTLTRTVMVESVNAMNLTSILIIVAVILVFAGSIAIAIWFEIKRRREEI